MRPEFTDTKTAFKHRSNKELRKARFIFSMIRYPFLVKTGKALLHFALFIRFPIVWLLKPGIFKHFCGGESIDDSAKSIQELHNRKCFTILDYSAEGQGQENDFLATTDQILKTIRKAKNDSRIPFAVFKMTGIASFSLLEKNAKGVSLNEEDKKSWEQACQRFEKICQTAYENETPLMVDAEESWIQKPIDKLVIDAMRRYNKEKAIIFNTVQLYLTDRLSFLKEQIHIARSENFFTGFKLVRGAYMEKERLRAESMNYPSPVHEKKQQTDKAYNQGILHCLDNIDIVSFVAATHNEDSIRFLASKMTGLVNNSDKRIWFSQLYGMSDHITFTMTESGFNLAKYVPFGPVKKVLPYLIRRAEENTSVAGQTGRELSLINKEIQRRKKQIL